MGDGAILPPATSTTSLPGRDRVTRRTDRTPFFALMPPALAALPANVLYSCSANLFLYPALSLGIRLQK